MFRKAFNNVFSDTFRKQTQTANKQNKDKNLKIKRLRDCSRSLFTTLTGIII